MQRISWWVGQRNAPVAATIAIFIPVMGYTLLGHADVHGHYELTAPDDLWGLTQSAWALAHGQFARIYAPHGTVASPPALPFVLVPVLLVTHAIGVAPGFPTGTSVSLWLFIGPVAIVLGSTALFAIDAVAREWSFSERSRLVLAGVGALGVATVVGGWGHPEDCIALALVVWAALSMERLGVAGAPRAALLLGLAIAFQPIAILGVAAVLARLSWRGAARLWWRLLVPTLLVLIPPLLAERHQTLYVLLKQPTRPKYNSFTPFTHLAPALGHGLYGGGPTRSVVTLLAVAVSVLVCHRRYDLPTVLAATAVAFFLRVLFETELNWYYLWPVPALCLLLSMRRSRRRFWLCSISLVASLAVGDHNEMHHNVELWWPALMATLVLMLLSIGPSPSRWLELARRRLAVPVADGVEVGSVVGADLHPVELSPGTQTISVLASPQELPDHVVFIAD